MAKHIDFRRKLVRRRAVFNEARVLDFDINGLGARQTKHLNPRSCIVFERTMVNKHAVTSRFEIKPSLVMTI